MTALTNVWQANTAYVVGDKILPTAFNSGTAAFTMKVHVCTTAGTSGGSEPSWATTEGTSPTGDTTDGGVTWHAHNAYFVDPSFTGGGNNGSQANPYTSWASVSWGSVDATNMGRAYYQKRGTTFTTRLFISTPNAGTFTNYSTIEPYGSGAAPIIDATADSANAYTAMQATNRRNWKMQGFKLIGGPVSGAGGGNTVGIGGATAFVLDGNEIIVSPGGTSTVHAVIVNGDGGATATGSITNNIITGKGALATGGGDGIFGYVGAANSYYDGLTVTGNTIKNCGSHGINLRCGVNASDALTTGSYRNVTITGNTIYDNGATGVQLMTGRIGTRDIQDDLIAGSQPYGINISSNTIYHNGDAGINVDGFYLTVANLIASNTVYDNCWNSTTGGLHVMGCENTIVEYNTVYNNHTTANIVGNAYDGVGIYLDMFPFMAVAPPYSTGKLNQGVIVRYNKCYQHDDYSLAVYTSEVAVAGSLGVDPPSCGIRLLGADSTEVYGNICYGNSVGIATSDFARNNKIYNNTVYDNGIGLYMGRGFDTTNIWKNNLVYRNQYNTLQDDEDIRTWGGTNITLGAGYATVNSIVDVTLSAANWTSDANSPKASIIRETGGGGGWGWVTYRTSTTVCKLHVRAAFSTNSYLTGAWENVFHRKQDATIATNLIYGATGDGNNLGGSGYELGNDLTASGTIASDPKLTSDGKIGAGGAGHRAGAHLGYKYRDHRGRRRLVPPSIGAYEPSSGDPAPILRTGRA